MPKLKNIAKRIQINPPAVKGLFLMAIMIGFSAFTATKHPFYLSVVDIKHDTKTQHLNISVKLFINDIENVDDPNESNWRVHKYFQKAFWQILGILIGLFFKLFNYI